MAGNLGCVLVAVDGSEESMNALKWALDNVKLRPPQPQSEPQADHKPSEPEPESESGGGYFLVLHVQSPPNIITGLNPGTIPFGGPDNLEVPAFAKAIESHQRRITEAIMSHALQICAEKKVNVKTKVVVGDPKEVIVEMVDNLHVDLLVMGCRPFGPIKRMFLGSVSNYCTNHAQCPVMIVKESS